MTKQHAVRRKTSTGDLWHEHGPRIIAVRRESAVYPYAGTSIDIEEPRPRAFVCEYQGIATCQRPRPCNRQPPIDTARTTGRGCHQNGLANTEVFGNKQADGVAALPFRPCQRTEIFHATATLARQQAKATAIATKVAHLLQATVVGMNGTAAQFGRRRLQGIGKARSRAAQTFQP